MPKRGIQMTSGTIGKWLVKEGESVKKGAPLAEIETDKVTAEIESPAEGVLLKILVAEGVSADVGAPIAVIGKAGESYDLASVKSPVAAVSVSAAAPVTQKTTQVASGGRPHRISPRAKKLAASKGFDYASLVGSGPGGRIMEKDIVKALQNVQPGSSAGKAAQGVAVQGDTVLPLKGMRKIIAERMKASLDTMAPANHRMDVDMSEIIALRKKLNALYESASIKISIVDLLVKITARTLVDFPIINSSLTSEGIVLHKAVNMGIAVAVEGGLVVPVLRDAHTKSLPEIAAASRNLIDRARKGELSSEDMSGGTFTITNLGMYDVDSFIAIINPPEAAILAIGAIRERVVVENSAMVIRPMVSLSLSFDHRIIDGAPAADFLKTLKTRLQNPLLVL
jgi:pyruvate dehydrogenase E2 component (dihydrolipoamide acetyltransferase)